MKNASFRAKRGTPTFEPLCKNEEVLNLNTGNVISRFLASLVMTIALILMTDATCFSQTKAQVKNVDFELVNDNLIITYDIVKYKPDEKFSVWIGIYTAMENELGAKSLSGDINDSVSGGNHKKIIWDVRKDGISLDNDIYVQVHAKSMTKVDEKTATNIGKWLLLSSLFPGVGNAKLYSNKAWWIMGAATYGCVVASVIFNNQSYNTYNDYLVSTDAEQRKGKYDAAANKKTLSYVFISTAAAIWATDLVGLIIKSTKVQRENTASKKTSVSYGYHYNPVNDSQMLSVRLNF